MGIGSMTIFSSNQRGIS